MKRQLFFLLAVAFIISSCGKPAAVPSTATAPPPSPTKNIVPSETPLPTVTPACVSPGPTQKDVDRALSFVGDAFDSPEWEKNDAVSEDRVSITWQNITSSAMAYLEVITFPCGYEEPDLNARYNNEFWKTTFQNYEDYKMETECKRNDGLRLYEFKAQNLGFKYGVNYWVKNDTDTRVVSLMLVFPLELDAMMSDYSTRLFPTYTSCP